MDKLFRSNQINLSHQTLPNIPPKIYFLSGNACE